MKTIFIISIALFSCIIVVVGCKKTSKTLVIGSSYGGGKVAYLLQAGDTGYSPIVQHGLIAAIYDQSSGIQWGCFGTSAGTSANGIGSGAANTDSTVKYCGPITAAYLCHTLTLGGYADWYLPSNDELNELYLNQTAIGGFASADYWSSSEYDGDYAWVVHFSGGGLYQSPKDSLYNVRAVRSF